MGAVVGLVAAAVTACVPAPPPTGALYGWVPYDTSPGPWAARPCRAGIANTFRIDPSGFSAQEVNDLVAAVGAVRQYSGIPFTHVVGPVPAADRAGIVVRQRVLVDPSGRRRGGWAPSYDTNGDGLFDNSVVIFDPQYGSGAYRAGPTLRWGAEEMNFFKLAVHEFMHIAGLGDLYTLPANLQALPQIRDNLMTSETRANLGAGDLAGLAAMGCPGDPRYRRPG